MRTSGRSGSSRAGQPRTAARADDSQPSMVRCRPKTNRPVVQKVFAVDARRLTPELETATGPIKDAEYRRCRVGNAESVFAPPATATPCSCCTASRDALLPARAHPGSRRVAHDRRADLRFSPKTVGAPTERACAVRGTQESAV